MKRKQKKAQLSRPLPSALIHPSSLSPHPLLFWRRVRDSNSHTARRPLAGFRDRCLDHLRLTPLNNFFECVWQGRSDLN